MNYKIAIVGTGNVAFHLAGKFHQNRHQITIISRSAANGKRFCEDLKINLPVIYQRDQLRQTYDFVILAVPDGEIQNVLNKYRFEQTIILHASGAQDIRILREASSDYGILYPFQTFTKNKEVHFEQIPILIEGSSRKVLAKIRKLAEELGPKIHELSSEERLKVHLAAVFASNFSNHLFTITDELLKGSPMQLKDFSHLIGETVAKAMALSPRKAQTGPAIRNDQEVMKKHLEFLDSEELKALYVLHSKLINRPSPID